MAINFPSSPALNQTITVGSNTWIWNGNSWAILPVTSPSFSNITVSGSVTGNLVGSVTGTVSSIANHDLEDLGNISTTAATNGQVLGYNSGSSEWEPISLTSTFTGGTVPNAINITSNTAATSTSTGAFTVTGGVGIGGSMYLDGNFFLEGSYISLDDAAELRFYDSDNSNYISFQSPSNATETVTYILPTADGDSGQVLTTNGSGILSWATVAGGGGGGGSTPPGGSTTQVQFNNAGVFGGNASLTFNLGTQTLTVPTVVATGNFSSSGTFATSNTTASTTTTTGSITTSGGVGVAGQLNVGGAVNKFTSSTTSTSTTTGALIITGGVGIGGTVNVGSTVTASTAPTNSSHLTNKAYVDAKTLAFSMAFGV